MPKNSEWYDKMGIPGLREIASLEFNRNVPLILAWSIGLCIYVQSAQLQIVV